MASPSPLGVLVGEETGCELAQVDELVVCEPGEQPLLQAPVVGPLRLSQMESMMVFETAKGFIAGKAGKHYPAPVEAVKAIQKAGTKARDEALKIEGQGFAKVAKTPQADALNCLFLNDQFLKKKA